MFVFLTLDFCCSCGMQLRDVGGPVPVFKLNVVVLHPMNLLIFLHQYIREVK